MIHPGVYVMWYIRGVIALVRADKLQPETTAVKSARQVRKRYLHGLLESFASVIFHLNTYHIQQEIFPWNLQIEMEMNDYRNYRNKHIAFVYFYTVKWQWEMNK